MKLPLLVSKPNDDWLLAKVTSLEREGHMVEVQVLPVPTKTASVAPDDTETFPLLL